ncbi:MAG: DeoR/GlpR transcriptional regulator [Oscillospiraceae bacterium]|nr:DeoR/GlpR transcriptional regulator [Oscillospiraceae bacterium]
MKTAAREQKIISLLESRGELEIAELSAILNISASTLRKQLADMQSRKLIIRTYGGVMSINPVPDESFDSKLQKNVSAKRKIALKARSLITEGSSVSLGSGTTIYALSNLMDDLSGSAVFTNSMQVAEYLSRFAALDVHISGGIIRSSTGTIIGSESYNFFERQEADYAFISCDAIDEKGIVYSDNLAVATVERAVLKNARHRYVLCDATKLGKKSVAEIWDLRSCDGLITDSVSGNAADKLQYNVNVILA